MTSHSKMLLSLTSPHDIPGMSLSACICLSCLPNSAAAPELDAMTGDSSRVLETGWGRKMKDGRQVKEQLTAPYVRGFLFLACVLFVEKKALRLSSGSNTLVQICASEIVGLLGVCVGRSAARAGRCRSSLLKVKLYRRLGNGDQCPKMDLTRTPLPSCAWGDRDWVQGSTLHFPIEPS